MMKIAYIANIRLPTEKAHGLQIMKTCEAMAAQGIDLDLIIPRRINFIKQDPFEFYGVKNNFKIKKIWCLDFLVLPLFKTLWFWLESIGFAKVIFIYAFFRKYSVYYTRELPIAIVLCFKSAPLFYEIHTISGKGMFWHKLAWKRARALIVISQGIKNKLINLGVPAEKIFVARDAVDIEKFKIQNSKIKIRQELNLPVDAKIVLYAGHLYGWKGADILAEAAKLLPSEIKVCIVGGTADDIIKFKSQYSAPNLLLAGWQEPSQIPFWLKATDILILPNSAKTEIGAIYTSPLKLFEYMASGVPIIASDVPAIREILGPESALFFVPDSPRSLAEIIVFGLKNEDKLTVKARLAQEAVKQYSWQKRGQKILEIIKICLIAP